MDTADQASRVTQREFYSALTLVWTFIMLAFSATLFGGSPSANRSWASVLYWAVSLLMAVNYAVASLRGGVSGRKVVFAVVVAGAAILIAIAAYFVGGSSH